MLIESFCESLAPAYAGTALDWCEENVIIPHSARSKEFHRDFAPWHNEVLLRLSDDSTKKICLRAPTGGGKTSVLEVVLPYLITLRGGPTLLIGQTDDSQKEWCETRLIPVLESCEPAARLFPQNRHDKRKTAINFPHMMLVAGGANLTNLQEKSCRYVFGDEIWQWKKGMIREMRARTHDRHNSKIYLASQGWDEGHDMDGEWNQSTEYTWGFSCPECQTWQRYIWDQMKYTPVKVGDEYDWPATCATVFYKCAHCDATFANDAKSRRALSARGSYQQTSGDGMTGHVAFTYPAYAVWWISWADLVMEWIVANDAKRVGNFDLLRQFVMKRKAEVWKEEDTTPAVKLMPGNYVLGDYANGQKWEGESFRFMTIDRQQDHFWTVVRAWNDSGDSRLLACGKVFTVKELEQIAGRYGVQPSLTFEDAQFSTNDVYADCAARGWTALHGSGENSFCKIKRNGQKVWRPYTDVKTATPPGCNYIHIAVNLFKDQLARLRGGLGVKWETPKDIGQEYRAQMNSEVKKRTITNKVTGASRMLWCQIGHRPNHLWDCEMMQVAAATMMGVLGIPDVDIVQQGVKQAEYDAATDAESTPDLRTDERRERGEDSQ